MNYVLHTTRLRQARCGFTLLEVLIAMGIFSIGFIAIAAPLFVAVQIQGETIDDVNVHQVERSAEAVVRGLEITESDLVTAFVGLSDPNFDIDGLIRYWPSVASNLRLFLPTGARSYPSSKLDYNERRYYWQLMIRDNDTRAGTYDFHVYLFVMRRGDYHPVPTINSLNIVSVASQRRRFDLNSGVNGIVGKPSMIRPGDQILDQYGGLYRVAATSRDAIQLDAPVSSMLGNPNTLYFARYVSPPPSVGLLSPPSAATAPSPIRSIRLLSDVIQ